MPLWPATGLAGLCGRDRHSRAVDRQAVALNSTAASERASGRRAMFCALPTPWPILYDLETDPDWSESCRREAPKSRLNGSEQAIGRHPGEQPCFTEACFIEACLG